MNKYISFLLVPIMLFGISGSNCYSMDNYKQEVKKKAIKIIGQQEKIQYSNNKKLQNEFDVLVNTARKWGKLYDKIINIPNSYKNIKEILSKFSCILKNTVDMRLCSIYVPLKYRDTIIRDSNIKNQLREILDEEITTLDDVSCCFSNKLILQVINMQQQVLKLMGIDVDSPVECVDIIDKKLQQMSPEQMLKNIGLVVTEIDNILCTIKHFMEKTIPIIKQLEELYKSAPVMFIDLYHNNCESVEHDINRVKELLSPNKTKNDTNDNYQHNNGNNNKLNKIDNEFSNNITNKNYLNDNNKIVSDQNFSVVDNKENFNKWNKTNQISNTQSFTYSKVNHLNQ